MGTDAQHLVRLTVAERVQWEAIVTDSRAAKGRVWRSRMLLMADAEGPAWPDSQIADAFEGFDAALLDRSTMAEHWKECIRRQVELMICSSVSARHTWPFQRWDTELRPGSASEEV